jgi:hypothetical protein
MRKFAIWFSILAVLAVLIWLLIPRSHIIDSPFIRQISAMQQICKKLRDYNYDHPNLKPADVTNRGVTDYVAIGVLSTDDAAYIRDHNIIFHGFDPSKIAGDIPVLEAIYTKHQLQKRIVGYGDASVVTYDLGKTQ